jgi:hypothetical protein
VLLKVGWLLARHLDGLSDTIDGEIAFRDVWLGHVMPTQSSAPEHMTKLEHTTRSTRGLRRGCTLKTSTGGRSPPGPRGQPLSWRMRPWRSR